MRFLYFFLVLILMGCKQYVYRPTTIKTTNFTAKGDCEVSLNVFTMGECHAAYAITDHLALSGTLSYGNNRDTNLVKDSVGQLLSTSVFQRKYRDKELSIGYFIPVGDGSTFELFGGMGFAQRHNTTQFTDHRNSANNFTSDHTDNRYSRIFFQPAFGRNGKYVDVSIANRFSFIHYEKTNTRDFISESACIVRYGYKNIKIMSQFGFTLFNINSSYGYLPFTFGFGIYLMFNQSLKTQE